MSNILRLPVRHRPACEPDASVRFEAGTGAVFMQVLIDGEERELAFSPDEADELAQDCAAAVRTARYMERVAKGER